MLHCYNYTDCEVTASTRLLYVNYLMSLNDSSGTPTFGWIEKDGNLGDNTGPTSPNEIVYVGETVDAMVVVHINPCFRWSDLSSVLKFTCFVVEIPGPWDAVGWARWARAQAQFGWVGHGIVNYTCLLYTSPSPRDGLLSRMPSSA